MLQIPLLFVSGLTHMVVMPIRPENRWLYPIDWQQLSDTIRFERAGGRCERCARPHLRFVAHLGDGRWWDADTGYWRSDRGRRIAVREQFDMLSVRTTYVVLACAHLDHDPGHNLSGNLAALCQRCHMLHDAPEHRWQRWWNVFRRRALRDLYEDPHLTRERLAHHTSPAGGRGDRQSSRLPDTSPPMAGRRGNPRCTVGQVRPTPELRRRIGPATDTGSAVPTADESVINRRRSGDRGTPAKVNATAGPLGPRGSKLGQRLGWQS